MCEVPFTKIRLSGARFVILYSTSLTVKTVPVLSLFCGPVTSKVYVIFRESLKSRGFSWQDNGNGNGPKYRL